MNWMVKASMTVGLTLGLSSVAMAQSAAESDLLSAQQAYQEILRNSQSQKSTLSVKQEQLNTAKQRLSEIQSPSANWKQKWQPNKARIPQPSKPYRPLVPNWMRRGRQ